MSTRIAVTGVGLVTSLGKSREETWRRLVLGERDLRPVSAFDAEGQRASLVAEVADLEVPGFVRGVAWSRTSTLARLSAREALAHAGLTSGQDVGLIVGGTTGGMLENEIAIAAMYPDAKDVHPEPALRSHPLSSTVDALCRDLGSIARARTVASACSGGASAITLAASWLLSGEIDRVLVGAAEALCRLTLTGFNALGVIDPEPSRPFDRARRGLNLGEGAGFLVLEREDAARARGARSLAELAGWALVAEAHHVTNPEPSGESAARVMREALARAGVQPSDVDWVSAHGTGTPLNDKTEALAIARAIGERAWVSSAKGQIGHTLGAAGAIEAAFAALAVERDEIPPSVGAREPDPESPIRIARERQATAVNVALSNAFGFGGMDSALVFTKPGFASAPPRARRRAVITGVAISTPHGLERGAEVARATAPRSTSGLEASDDGLDPARARRLDRPARVSIAVARAALDDAEREGTPLDRESAGAVVATAFGCVHGSAAFMRRVVDKGARLAPPADFPNLVPSATAGHLSIYLGLRGPAMVTCDLTASAEAALATAFDLVASGEARAVVTGAVGERGPIIDRVFAPIFGLDMGTRPEVASALVVEDEESARARGAEIHAKIDRVLFAWRGERLAALGARAPRAVFLGDHFGAEAYVRALLAETEFAAAEVILCAPGSGKSEVSGGVALSAAAEAIGRGALASALVLGPRPLPGEEEGGWTCAVLLSRP